MRIWRGTPLGFERDNKPIDYHAGDDAGGNAPCLVLGPPGSLKSVGPIACQLLDDDSGERSYVIFGDGKAELTAITSKFRRTVSHVAIANYAGVLVDKRPDLKSAGYNALRNLDPRARGFAEACEAAAIAIVKPEPDDRNKHFTDAARSAASLAISREVKQARAEGRPADIGRVRSFLLQEPKKLREAIEEIMRTGDEDERTRAAKFLHENTEIQNIKSTLEVATSWITPEIRADMATSNGIDFLECKKHPVTYYFIVPANEMKAKAPYTRLALSDCLRSLYQHDGIPTTVIIEEAFVLGYHEEIEQALSILRGYNSRLTIVFQSYQQIKKLYPDTHGLFTAGATLAFRPGDLETAEMLVKRIGKHIVAVLSAADPSRPGEAGVRPSWQQQLRDRIPLTKLFGMPKGRALVWKPGDEVPRVSWVKGYFELPELNKRASENPYFRPASGDPDGGAPPSKSGSMIGFALAGLIIGLLLLSL